MLPASQRKQSLRFLDVVHSLLCDFGIRFSRLDCTRLFQFFSRLIQAWIIDLRAHVTKKLENTFRLLFDNS